MLAAGAGEDHDARLGVLVDLFHRVDHIDHELKADRVGTLGTVEGQVSDTVPAFEKMVS
jgi:hypothetical protein